MTAIRIGRTTRPALDSLRSATPRVHEKESSDSFVLEPYIEVRAFGPHVNVVPIVDRMSSPRTVLLLRRAPIASQRSEKEPTALSPSKATSSSLTFNLFVHRLSLAGCLASRER